MPSFTSIISHGNSEKLVTHLLSSWTTTIYGRESTCPSSSVSSTSSEHVLVPAMLACSAKKLNHVELPGLHFTVKLCVDRQRPLEHLAPRRLLKSTLWVTTMKATQSIAKYMTDSLKIEISNDEAADDGYISQAEADKRNAEWAKDELQHRLKEFPIRVAYALLKYHSTILLMRFYEHLAERLFCDDRTMDSLTLDTAKYAKRMSNLGIARMELGKEMCKVSLWANLIGVLADYSIHQLLLAFSYVTYVRHMRRRKHTIENESDTSNNDNMPGGHIVLSIIRKSTLMALSRCLGLYASAVGSAVGSMILPGLGTTAGTNLGDAVFSVVAEEAFGTIP